MPDVEHLFRDYVAEHREGGAADPRQFLTRVDGAERTELAGLIDAYLARSPGRQWDAAAFAGSAAERITDQVAAQWAVDESDEAKLQGWREILPALRSRAQVMRRDLVDRLAEGIGHPEAAEKVAAYYHQMETGQLPAERVSDRVLSVLGEILGESAEKLRAAGSAVAGGAGELSEMQSVAYARLRLSDQDQIMGMASPADPNPGASADEPEPSELDRLFTGGPEAS